MIRLAALCLCLLTPVALAQDLPALHAVTGVANDDVLNIRSRPKADAAIIGTLPPDSTGIEVVAVEGDWAVVNTAEATGYAALRYLRREDRPAWNSLEAPLTCLGTEPFWSLTINRAAGIVGYQTPEMPEPLQSPLTETWPGVPWSPSAALALPEGLAVLQPLECSDGMSDRSYGISVDVFLQGTDAGAGWSRLSGCCLLGAP